VSWVERLTVECLGSLRVALDGRPVEITARRLRTTMVALALAAGKTVPNEQLISAIWNDALPNDPRSSLHSLITRLRATIGPAMIRTEPTGYRLQAEPDDVDALRFLRLVSAPTFDREQLEEALGLWRGVPFVGMGSLMLEQVEGPRLVELYLNAVERCADLADLDGKADEQLARLTALADEHPLRESLWARLLIALDHCGRSAEALERYEMLRSRIADRLGVDPSSQLQAIHAQLLGRSQLTQDAAMPPTVVPQQLPADIDLLVGRAADLKTLDDLLAANTAPLSTRKVAIMGTAGVGKTALAVHWAHRVAHRFPDGQLYVDLHGFEPTASPLHPSDALRGFLIALQVAPPQIPTALHDQAALFRTLLTGKRVLVVLDNCRDAEQIRPLLPGSGGSFVLMTSRNQLPGLVATGVEPMVLDVLPQSDARSLLTERLGAGRVDADPSAATEIAALCSGLPLALSMVAARALIHPDFRLDALAAELHEVRGRLDVLSTEDSAVDVRAVLSWSYRTLGPDAARMFRLLGLHPGPHIGVDAAASLAALTVGQVQNLLAELRQSHLIVEAAPGRYLAHDLLRAYAAELVQHHESATDRREAVHRLLDHYLYTTLEASRVLDGFKIYQTPEPALAGVIPEVMSDAGQVRDWYAREHSVLVGLVDLASGSEFEPYVPQLADAMTVPQSRGGRWHEWLLVQERAIESAQRLGDRYAEARARTGLAQACNRLERYDEAAAASQDAIELFRDAGEPLGEAIAHRTRLHACDRLGQLDEVLAHGHAALELYRSIGNERGEAHSLNALGWAFARLGEYQRARSYCLTAVERLERLADRPGQAAAWDSLGYIQLHLQKNVAAANSYEHSAQLYRALGDRGLEAVALVRLGDVQHAAGRRDAAHAAWGSALTNLEELGHPGADTVRAMLHRPAPTRDGSSFRRAYSADNS
jgi:DNA-binding SARP family transcriptional activator/tetratricopeptide (TPR) repeat protein